MADADLDVVLVAYKRNHLLVQCLEMLDRQVEANISVIVCDDGSNVFPPIQNFECVSKYLWAKHTGYHLTARLNEGLSYVTAPAVVFLSDDCQVRDRRWAKGHLSSLVGSDVVRGYHVNEAGLLELPPFMSFVNVSVWTECLKSHHIAFDMAYDGGYGYEDHDFGKQIERAKLRVVEGSRETAVKHVGIPSACNVSEANRSYYKQKWGIQ